MAFLSYYEQEPMSANAAAYHDHLIGLMAGQKPGTEVRYGDDPYQSLLVYPADQPDGSALVFFHGGGWTNGYKEWMAFMAPALNAQGITFVTAGYRLAPGHMFPTAMHDCAAAVNWVGGNAARLGIDPARIFVGGHSAGGHHAALLAVLGTQAGLSSPTLIRGCAPVSGVYYFGPESGMAVRPRFLGPVEERNEAKASPIEHVQGTVCPFLISYGSQDFPHLVRQAREMAERLHMNGTAVQTLVLPDCDHFEASYAAGEPGGLWVNTLKAWMTDLSDKESSAPAK